MGWAADRGGFAIDAAVDERLGFLRKTYGWLTGQIIAVAALTSLFMQSEAIVNAALNLIYGNILIYILLFMGLSFITRKMLEGHKPMNVQVAGAALWVVFLSALCTPLCYFVIEAGHGAKITQAVIMTTGVFAGLTTYVLVTKKDFSWARSIIFIASWTLLGVGVVLAFGGGVSGIWYSALWVGLLSLWTLYDTSQVLHHRGVNEYVAASVDLLLDFVFLFIHILMLLMNRD
jgi:FtsH-binding integral membrane protein